ncbi:hypothetical protein FOVG_01402 [Fusarium oxysporum f. sp. pisi HDV247]|uniref:Uncharacterized protein n=1 Tax=Fusarium oxysporum f. sp. pisi HDV247 TaxID=1080344 RepID=W9Q848_FUSOX|nr:hypothetical protein FOVG_01402 [Fusarium oxysporum f. sp. pisi HDV247]RKK79591.1 hypothetical protein BFJ71_g16175 [Fusarium oxysporum]
MKLGKLEGVPDRETCYRLCESLDGLRDKLGPGFKIKSKCYLYRGLEFTVVTGIQEKQAGGLRVVGYYKKEYYRDWYLVH